MSIFNVGDRVRCITDFWDYITQDNVYTVTNIDGDGIYLTVDRGDANRFYVDTYFELVKDTKFNVGDKVRWIDKGNTNYKAIGKVIKVYSDICDICSVEFFNRIESGWDCDGLAKGGHGYNIREKYLELVSPKEKLIETDMDTEDIKNFPKAVLVKAEKQAKEELANEQEEIAVAKFKELFGRIADKERELSRVQSELKDLRGEAKITNK